PRGWVWMRCTSSPSVLMPCCSISLLRRLETRYCLFSPSRMPQAFSRKTRNCSKSKLPVDTATASFQSLRPGHAPAVSMRRLDPVDHSLGQVVRLELGQEVIGADLLDHGLVEYPRQGSMQEDVQVLHARIAANLRSEGIAIHLGHFDV